MNELLDYKKQVNAEFKNLRLRILKLEEILLKQKIDSGSLKDPVKRLKKG